METERNPELVDPTLTEEREEQRNEKWFERAEVQPLLITSGVLIYILLGLVLWWVLDLYIDPQNSVQKKDLLQALGLIMAGLAGAVGVYFTWRNLTLTQRNIEDTRKVTQEQLRLAEAGQVTERFTNAIKQLGEESEKGDPRLEIRIGGIYALERIARDSPERDYSTVMEVLTTYVRNNAPRPAQESSAPAPVLVAASTVDEGANQPATPKLRYPAADIQAILHVFGRRAEDRVPDENGVTLDLRNTELCKADLRKANFREADLRDADLQEANLREADLRATYLLRANLQRANLQRADLREADLRNADFQGAYLQRANLQRVNLREADLRDAYLQRADLQRAYLERADLRGANLQEVVGLDLEHIQCAIGSEKTELPGYLIDHRPAAWSKGIEEQVKIIEDL
jgi:hypothetical protein